MLYILGPKGLGAYTVALEQRFGFGGLQTLDRRASLYFDYAIPLFEKLTAAAKLGAKEYVIVYEQVRPKEEKKEVKGRLSKVA
jgi:hypothetical protein